MSVSAAINNARSGLQVSGLRASVVATNVANASTPGYVRRSVTLSTALLGTQSAGVQSDGVTRAADSQIKTQRRTLTTGLAQASVLASTWQSVATRVGSTADGSSLFKTFSNLESALSTAATTPESSANLSAVLNAARAIATELNSLSQFASRARIEADREIGQGVAAVNAALKQIESLNERISSMDRTTAQAATLMDERQMVLDQIAEYLPIQTVERERGTLDVLTVEGVFLVGGTRARQIEFNPTAAFNQADTHANGVLSGLMVDGIDLTPGASSFGAVSSGMFGALFTLRDQDLPAFMDQLDAIAADLVARLSDDAVDPTKTPGEDGLFVDPASGGTAGLAGRIAINAAVDPQQGGDLWRLRDGIGAASEGPAGNSMLLSAMFNAFTRIQSTNSAGMQGAFSAAEMVAQFSSLTGQKRIHHEAVLSSVQTQHAALVEAEQSLTGVDIDRQMEELLMIEQAYAANARVIQVASQMIQLLMEI